MQSALVPDCQVADSKTEAVSSEHICMVTQQSVYNTSLQAAELQKVTNGHLQQVLCTGLGMPLLFNLSSASD